MASDPAMEHVDIIDQEGRTIGTTTRQEMRLRRLPHRCVYLLVFNGNGELFVHLRTPTKDVYPNHWDVAVGGVLVAGETFEMGARREALEELGVPVDPEPLFPFRYADERTAVDARVYRVVHDGPFRLQPEEIIRGEFWPLALVLPRTITAPFCPDGLAVLAEWLRRQGTGSK